MAFRCGFLEFGAKPFGFGAFYQIAIFGGELLEGQWGSELPQKES